MLPGQQTHIKQPPIVLVSPGAGKTPEKGKTVFKPTVRKFILTLYEYFQLSIPTYSRYTPVDYSSTNLWNQSQQTVLRYCSQTIGLSQRPMIPHFIAGIAQGIIITRSAHFNFLIEHIYDFRLRRFYTFEQMRNLYDISKNDFLKYFNIVSNISKEWKNKLKNENVNTTQDETKRTLHIVTKQKGSINKSLYNIQLVAENVPKIKAEEKWSKEIPQHEMNWPQFYLMSFNCTVDVKLRNFNYKYLMRIIPNNKYLFNHLYYAIFVQGKRKLIFIFFGNVGTYRNYGHKFKIY